MTRANLTLLIVVAALLLPGCKKKAPPANSGVANDGSPTWLDNPYAGKDAGTHICTSAQSDFAAVDVEAAKTDAETAAKNRVADQVNAKVSRLTERLSSAMKDLANGRTVGERTIRDINQNFVEMSLPGLRYLEYHYLPDRLSPEVVYVWVCVDYDSIEMSKQITDAMIGDAAVREVLEGRHEEAQLRFDAVRQQYLNEEGAP
jgi:hypothetical protein